MLVPGLTLEKALAVVEEPKYSVALHIPREHELKQLWDERESLIREIAEAVGDVDFQTLLEVGAGREIDDKVFRLESVARLIDRRFGEVLRFQIYGLGYVKSVVREMLCNALQYGYGGEGEQVVKIMGLANDESQIWTVKQPASGPQLEDYVGVDRLRLLRRGPLKMDRGQGLFDLTDPRRDRMVWYENLEEGSYMSFVLGIEGDTSLRWNRPWNEDRGYVPPAYEALRSAV